MKIILSLQMRATIWIISAGLAGILSSWLWMYSEAQWKQHLHKSYMSGLSLFETVRDDTPPIDGLQISELPLPLLRLAENGRFSQFPEVAPADHITLLSLGATSSISNINKRMALAIISPDLKYPVAELEKSKQNASGASLASVTRLLASYCSNATIFIAYENKPWVRVDGNAIWGCQAAPTDYRLLAAAIPILTLAFLSALIVNTSSAFLSFANILSGRWSARGSTSYSPEGPTELRAMITAINAHRKAEGASLSKRAMFLSGVSHDLGTPAARLRLRTALIEDDELRHKMDADIDRMTGMIQSVLDYTQSEMNVEKPRKMSLVALVDAVVADFQDAGYPVTLQEQTVKTISTRTIFSDSKPTSLRGARLKTNRMIVMAQPLSLQRAISNLIDNALKYGRKAIVSLESSSEIAEIHIDDFGVGMSEDDLALLTAPFKRGENTAHIEGFGMGLTVASTIAEQHGGSLHFQNMSDGLRATLTIARQ
ncbi:MAG: HAMP domain-containing histidine kinase [Candidatus Puniceispirillum sp.]|jgi:signal transduction histidine kinase|uniref:sensor histidine kinase n=1 Tax=Candidatus Puniceispirillum sp. TaxID=2026719 RepID=UPI001ED35356|nr:HAMP domain-containing histidine kinase [Candidatus Puniceispirillum sp.]MBT6416733.1 HAMP domain-containing histidine kinase [Candidatus Puniceispirillum sp.]